MTGNGVSDETTSATGIGRWIVGDPKFVDFGLELDRQLNELRAGVANSAHHLSMEQGFRSINARLDAMQTQIDALTHTAPSSEDGDA